MSPLKRSYKLFTQKFPWIFNGFSKPYFCLFLWTLFAPEWLWRGVRICAWIFCVHSFIHSCNKETLLDFLAWPRPYFKFHTEQSQTCGNSGLTGLQMISHWIGTWLNLSEPHFPHLSIRELSGTYLMWLQILDGEKSSTFQESRNATTMHIFLYDALNFSYEFLACMISFDPHASFVR